MSSKSFLVTGASGFLGYHTCKYLVERGHSVKGIDIHEFDYPDLGDSFRFYQGDIRDKEPLREALEDVDIVIHSAAALPLWSKEEIFSTNVGGTKNVLTMSLEQGVERVIFISSTSVYGIPKTHPVDENYPLRGVGPYGESKIEAEKACFAFREKGLCVPVLRPKTFAGPLRLGVFQILCNWVKCEKNIPIIGKGKNKYQLLHVEDLVEAIYLSGTEPKEKVNATFNVGATEFDTMKEDLQKLLDYAGYGKRVIAIPSWLVIPALKVLEKLHLSPLYEWVYETADKDHYVSVEKIQQVLGWKPNYTTADVWTETYKWYLEGYEEMEGKTGVTHRVAWDQGILAFVRRFF